MSTLARARPKIRLDRTIGPIVVEWIEEYLVHGPGDVQGQRVKLDDEQIEFLFRAYAIDDRGKRIVRRAAYSRPKGRAKSELAGFIVCVEGLGPCRFDGWDAEEMPVARPVTSPFIPCVATEETQAGNTYGAVEFMLGEGAIANTSGLDVGKTRTILPGGGEIRAFTAKASSKDGGKETFANFDETHLYTSDELHRLIATIRRNLTKRRAAEPWSLETTTMYAPGEESVAEHSHRYAERIAKGERVDPGFLFDHREGPDPETFDYDDDDELYAALVEAYGEASEWMDFERIIADARDPGENADQKKADVVRYFLNRPSRNEATRFLSLKTWKAIGDGARGIPEDAKAALGADGSRTHDLTAVAWAARADDGRVDVDCRIFSVRRTAPHHELHEGKIDYDAVEDFIVDRFAVYDVAEAAYDPRYLERSAEILDRRLPEAAIIAVEPQSKHMKEALGSFERGVIEGIVRHRGDPVIQAHVANAIAERGEHNEIKRVRKSAPSKPIDAVIAMALAYWRAVQMVDGDYIMAIGDEDDEETEG